MSNSKKQTSQYILTATLLIYFFTIIFHVLLFTIPNPQNMLGLVMVIPLLVITCYTWFQKSKIKKLWTSFSLSKTTVKALVFASVLPLALGLCLLLLFSISSQQYFLFDSTFLITLFSLVLLIPFALLEEVVWRGHFHVHLRSSYMLFQTSLMTAFIWSIWHLPVALLYKDYSYPLLGIIIYLVSLYIISLILSYLREYGKSVIPVAIMHGICNGFYFSNGANMQWALDYIELNKMVVLFVLFIMLVIIYRHKIKESFTL